MSRFVIAVLMSIVVGATQDSLASCDAVCTESAVSAALQSQESRLAAAEGIGRSEADRADHSLNLALDSLPEGEGPRSLRLGGGSFEGVDTVAAQVTSEVADNLRIQVYGFANSLDESGAGVGLALSF